MLGARIAALRKNAGLSQAQLAEALKISPSAVGMYEQSRREPSGELLVAMAKTLQVSVDYLLTGKTQSPQETACATDALLHRLGEMDKRVPTRSSAFSRQELIVLFAALLLDS